MKHRLLAYLAVFVVTFTLIGAAATSGGGEQPTERAVAVAETTTTTEAPTTTTQVTTTTTQARKTTTTHNPPRAASRGGHRTPGGTAILEVIAKCESGGRYNAKNPHSTASGKYQVLDSTWGGYGGYRRAMDAPPDVQEAHARELYALRGTQPWNASRHCWGRR